MWSISKPDHCAERASPALLSAYQEYLMTFKLMTSQVVQRARPLITHICVVGIQRVKKVHSLYAWCFIVGQTYEMGQFVCIFLSVGYYGLISTD